LFEILSRINAIRFLWAQKLFTNLRYWQSWPELSE
jgi:hypothetical protein